MKGVSIVIPCYNQAPFVADAVASALGQSYPAVEVIVVDDGSRDDPAAALAAFDGRITMLRQANRGLAAARNTGLHAAHGEYLLFLDSDDTLEPTAVAELVGLLEARPAAGLAYCAWRQVDASGRRLLGEVRPGASPTPLRDLLLRRFFFFASAALIRRSCLERVGPFDEALPWGEDADLWLRILLAGDELAYHEAPLMRYRVHDGSMTAAVSQEQAMSWRAGLVKFFGTPGLPAAIGALEDEAHAVLHFETAGRFFRAGQLAAGQEQLELGMLRHPTVDHGWLLDWLAGTALDPRTENPTGLIDLILGQLAAHSHPGLGRRRAYGRYHSGAFFGAYAAGDLPRVRRHLLPALRARPALLANRGFWSIAARALLDRRPALAAIRPPHQ